MRFRVIVSALTTAVIGLGLLTPGSATAAPEQPLAAGPSGYWTYWAGLAPQTLVMDVRKRQSANGTQIIIYGHNGNDNQWFAEVEDQQWGGYYIKPYFNQNKCLSVDGYGGPGALVRLWDCKRQSNQRFYFWYVGNNKHEITPAYDVTLCLTPRGTTTSGHAVEVQRCNGDTRMTWEKTGAMR